MFVDVSGTRLNRKACVRSGGKAFLSLIVLGRKLFYIVRSFSVIV